MDYVSPFDERRRAIEPLAPRRKTSARSDRRAARHQQAPRRRVPRPDRGSAPCARSADLPPDQGDLLQARRPGDHPPHRRSGRPRRGGPRRLRLLHVVQCARHGAPRAPGDPHRGGGDGAVHRRGTRAGPGARDARLPDGVHPHPVQLLSLEELHEQADRVFDLIVSRLTPPPDPPADAARRRS